MEGEEEVVEGTERPWIIERDGLEKRRAGDLLRLWSFSAGKSR